MLQSMTMMVRTVTFYQHLFTSLLSAAVVVGLEDVAYGGLENAGTIEVCAAILGECTASFPFTLYLNTSDDSAGTI